LIDWTLAAAAHFDAPNAPGDIRTGQVASQQTRIDDLASCLSRELAEFMRLRGGPRQDVEDGDAANQKGIGKQPPMTLPPDGFCAHNGSPRAYGKRQQIVKGVFEAV
jgi:hypothetical protein